MAAMFKQFTTDWGTVKDLEVDDNQKFINIHLSKFAAIPYGIRSDAEGVKIQIKYFNNLDDHT